MPTISHQTITLSKGNHRSPEEGACVMELASMLAGDPFSDHPLSVCSVIATFLRRYNDYLDDKRRQDLYRYASLVVGTRASVQVQRARAEHLASWSSDMRERRRSPLLPRAAAGMLARLSRPPSGIDSLARHALRSIGTITDETHLAALTLVEELVGIGAHEPSQVRAPDGGPGGPSGCTSDITSSTPAKATSP